MKSGQLVQVSGYNFLFLNHDNINVRDHFTGLYLFVSYYKSLLFGLRPGTTEPHKNAYDYPFRITSS